MTVQTQPRPVPVELPPPPELQVIPGGGPAADLHLFTYVVGNALAWVLWAAVSVSADQWYWWLVVPLAGWTLVLALHLWHAHGR